MLDSQEDTSSSLKNVDPHGQERGGLLNPVKNFIRDKMAPSPLPTETLGYSSETAFYGAKLKTDKIGQMYLDYRGAMPTLDRLGDRFSRKTDDHVMKDPVALMKRHPGLFVEHLRKGPKRYRGTVSEILDNINRLGLNDRYEGYQDENGKLIGIAIKNNFIEHGRTIRNLYRAQRGLLQGEGAKEFDDVDRFETLATATEFIKKLHEQHGGIGEVNADDVIFTKLEGNTLSEPTFSVPDIVYPDYKPDRVLESFQIRKSTLEIDYEKYLINSDANGARKVVEQIKEIDSAMAKIKEGKGVKREQQAIDLLDFLMDVVEEESNMENGALTRKAVETIINSYGEADVIATIESFIKRGRFTLAGDKLVLKESEETTRIPNLPDTLTTRQRGLLSTHNQTRVRIPEEEAIPIKKMIIDVCDAFRKANTPQPPSAG